ETRDLDVEIKKSKEIKANYGVTSPQELRRNQDNEGMSQHSLLQCNVHFEIKGHFMQELKEDTFSENKNDDAHKHVEQVLDIISLFNIPGVTHDAVMLHFFPITLTRATKRNIDSSSNSEGITAIVSKLDSLGRDMKKLKENVHVIQVGCQICEGAHLYKECPLSKEVQSIEEVIYGEFGRPFLNNSKNDEAAKIHVEQDEWLKRFYQNTKTNREAHDKIIQGLETKVKTLTNEVKGRTNRGKFKECKEIFTEDGSPLYTPFYYSIEEIKYFSANSGFFDNERLETNKSRMEEALATLDIALEIKQVPQKENQSVSYYVGPYEPPIPFPKRVEHHIKKALVHETMESQKKIKINRPLLKDIRKTDNYAKHMKDLVANKPKNKEDKEIRMNPRCSALLQNHLHPKEQDPGSFILP
ncbi:hypothetical protein Tco_0243304, partial [Tanacetum coccineum]